MFIDILYLGGVNLQDLEYLFYPKSVAVIGASKRNGINSFPLEFLMERSFKGNIYPINPNYTEIRGYKCYPSIKDVNDKIDVAIVLVNADRSVDVIRQCVEVNVHFAIILSAGFSETGNSGQKLEETIQEVINGKNTRVLGPNSIGLLNLKEKIPLGFAYPFSLKEYLNGSVAICSQSGAYGLGLWTRLQEERIGVKYLATTGNELDITIAEFINYYSTKPNINVIGVYIEGFSTKEDVATFFKSLEYARLNGKKVVILKSGKSEAGIKATQSHTASLTGAYDIFKVKCKQYGVYLVNNFTDQINVIKLLNNNKDVSGNKVGITTTSGALGIITADACYDYKLSVPQLTSDLKMELNDVLPNFSSNINPIDMTAQVMNEPLFIKSVLNALAESKQFDYIILLSSTISGSVAASFSQAAIEVNKSSAVPVLVCLTGGEMISREIQDVLQNEGISFFRSPEEAVRSMAYISDNIEISNYPNNVEYNYSPIKLKHQDFKTEKDSKTWLSHQGFKVPNSMFIKSPLNIKKGDETFELKWPVILKGQVNNISHKTEYGLVQPNINNVKELNSSLRSMWNIMEESFKLEKIQGILIEEQVQEAVEVLVGARWDALLGPVLIFGSGGIFVEILKDIALSKVPLTKVEAEKLIKESEIYPVLNGYRRGTKFDITSLINFIIQFSEMINNIEGNINEIEINPLFVLPENKGVKIIDALIV